MPTHAEERVLPYTPEQLFALVADIERYPEFLPWCVGARIKERRARSDRRRSDHRVSHVPRAVYLASVALPAAAYRCRLCRGAVPLSEQSLELSHRSPGGCRVGFFVDFEFKSRLLQRLIEVLFSEAVRRMVGAFEKRARDLYGAPSQRDADQPAT